jgi:O-antigen ligase
MNLRHSLLELLLYLSAALAPFSVEFAIWEGTQLTLPIEICLVVIGGGIVVSMPQHLGRLWTERWLLGGCLAWISWWWISAFFADQQVVAFKYVAAETLVALVCLLGAYLQPRKAVQALWYYGLSSLILQAWIVARHGWSYGFISDQANLAGIPFYYDHNLYATIAIMAVLVVRGIYGEQKTFTNAFFSRYLWWLICLTIALVSTSRGALLSVLATGGLFYFLGASKRMRWSIMVVLGVAVGLGMWQLRGKLQHDVSMRERINRYHCVWEMAQAHPLTGVGPGNFQFSYFAYQRPEYKTRISLNQPLAARDPSNYGHGGGAHSEYGRWLAEMGWTGWVLGSVWNIGMVVVLWRCRRHPLAYWIGAALCTLWLHSWINDFFHEARLSVWYWTLLGVILSLPKAGSDDFNKKTSNLP